MLHWKLPTTHQVSFVKSTSLDIRIGKRRSLGDHLKSLSITLCVGIEHYSTKKILNEMRYNRRNQINFVARFEWKNCCLQLSSPIVTKIRISCDEEPEKANRVN